MNDFWLYIKLGITHVLDIQAYDHVLFVIVLVAAYHLKQWKHLLILVSLFTFGHTVSLLLANYEIVTVSKVWIEFLIPITILITAFHNLVWTKNNTSNSKVVLLYITTIFFGLIHGFGFARYYKMIQTDAEILPLFEFAIGIEVAHILVVLFILATSFVFKNVFKLSKRDWVLVVSSIVIGLVIPMLQKTWPF